MRLGYQSCSNGMLAVRQHVAMGYSTFAGWEDVEYGGGEIYNWAQSGDTERLWSEFDRKDLSLVDGVALVVCAHSNHESTIGEDLEAVLGRLRPRVGAKPVYLSAMNGYTPRERGTFDLPNSTAFEACDVVVAERLAAGFPDELPGAVLPDLDESQLKPYPNVHENTRGAKACAAAFVARGWV